MHKIWARVWSRFSLPKSPSDIKKTWDEKSPRNHFIINCQIEKTCCLIHTEKRHMLRNHSQINLAALRNMLHIHSKETTYHLKNSHNLETKCPYNSLQIWNTILTPIISKNVSKLTPQIWQKKSNNFPHLFEEIHSPVFLATGPRKRNPGQRLHWPWSGWLVDSDVFQGL